MNRTRVVVGCLLCLMLIGASAMVGTTTPESELGLPDFSHLSAADQEVAQVVEGLIAVYNDPTTAALTTAQRAQLAATFYIPAGAYGTQDQPLYFGPLSDPVVTGAAQHLLNINTNFDQHTASGAVFKLGVTEFQIRRDGNMALFVAQSFSVLQASGSEVRLAGRWTLAMERYQGSWKISHEHVSFY